MLKVAIVPSEMDENLVAWAVEGDRAAQSSLMKQLYPGATTIARRMLGDEETAQDAVQEAFLRAFASLDQYDPTFRFSAWLFKILSNLIRDEWRRSGRVVVAEVEPEERVASEPLPVEKIIREETIERTRSEMEGLPEEERLAIFLHFQEGMNGREVAYVMGVTHQAARLRICRGVARLRARLTRES